MPSTPARFPSISVLHEIPDKHVAIEATDNCLAPLIFKGDIAVIDAALSWPTPGEFYAIRRDGKDELWLTDDAAGSLPGHPTEEAWLLSLREPHRWLGPCKHAQLDVIGRVVGLLDEGRPVGIEGDPAAVFYAEYQWHQRLDIQLQLERWALNRSKPPEDELFNLDLRIAPHTARRIALDSGICLAQSNTPEGALAKLQMLWHIDHQGDDPSDQTLEDGIALKTAIEALGGEAFYMKWTEEAVRERYGKRA